MKQSDTNQFKPEFNSKFKSELKNVTQNKIKNTIAGMNEKERESQNVGGLIEFSNPKIPHAKFGIKRSRYIPVAIKNALFEKSQGHCEYIGPTGIRCNSRYQIQIDHHHQAFCFGGENTIENLRSLCAQHNRLTASKKGIGFETTSHY
jgi:hypothetical protein